MLHHLLLLLAFTLFLLVLLPFVAPPLPLLSFLSGALFFFLFVLRAALFLASAGFFRPGVLRWFLLRFLGVVIVLCFAGDLLTFGNLVLANHVDILVLVIQVIFYLLALEAEGLG